ncbi:hypothetical protein [Paenibacillus lutrae]|uniref:Uncharacterized protein n=1 Tax=Paenibacillus lutrae TaxID=2078573 RepID=A0A7X3FF03_9BACL|nr:hypothetical protein [Paenibacillus lutrae]MVO98466.1 hypothetical protein [Paenibacillus lutrae]
MAGKGGKPAKKKKDLPSGREQYTMRIVESSTCAVCKQQCLRGIRYMERMSQPGSTGTGVPCILTRRKVT